MYVFGRTGLVWNLGFFFSSVDAVKVANVTSIRSVTLCTLMYVLLTSEMHGLYVKFDKY